MKAAHLVGPRRFEFTDVEVPAIRPGQLLVRLEQLSICGSDLRTYDRVFPEEEYPLRLGAPCHECAGVVVESLDERFRQGQRVIALQGGGLLEYAAVPAEQAVAIPDDGAQTPWVLCQPVGTVIYSVQQAGSVLGQRVVILGQGPIGLAFTDLIARAGARQVIVTDLHDYRLEAAKRLGATHTINASRENVEEAVRDITGGAMADLSVEACGRPQTCQQAFGVIRLQGRVVIFGMTHDEDVFPFDWHSMYMKLPQIVVTNSARAGIRAENVEACVDLVGQGRLDLSPYLTHRMTWGDVGRAYELYSGKLEDSLKVVMSVS
jgi:threonine dehydrogenase-like Zn-dependent dehydrogenase